MAALTTIGKRSWLRTATAAVMILVCAVALGVGFVAQAQQPRERGGERSRSAEPREERAPLPEGSVTLRYRFDEQAEPERFRLVEEARETTEDRGREMTQQRRTELIYTQRIEEVDEAKETAWLALTYERIRYRQQSTLNPTPLSFDSAAGEPPLDPALRPYAHLAGQTVRIRLGSDGVVHAVEGYSELLDEIFAELEEKPFAHLRQLLEQQFSNEAMRASLTRLYAVLPSRPVEPGDYWEQQLEQPVAFAGTLHSQTRYTLRRFEHDEGGRAVAVLGIETEYHQRRGEEDERQTLEVVPGVAGNATLEDGSMRGSVRLDLATGHVTASELEQNMALHFHAEDTAHRGAVVDVRSTTEATIRLERLAE